MKNFSENSWSPPSNQITFFAILNIHKIPPRKNIPAYSNWFQIFLESLLRSIYPQDLQIHLQSAQFLPLTAESAISSSASRGVFTLRHTYHTAQITQFLPTLYDLPDDRRNVSRCGSIFFRWGDISSLSKCLHHSLNVDRHSWISGE